MKTAVVLPLVAGILHLQVFYHAAFNFIFASFDDNVDNQPFHDSVYCIERSIFLAYTFDLVCCYVFKIVPFSRCKSGGEVSQHHIPVLLFILPLGIPVWARLPNIDPLFHGIIGTDTVVTSTTASIDNLKLIVFDKIRIIQGWAFFSSLNEFFMCFQRAEMSFYGIRDFCDIKQIPRQKRIMTRRVMIGIELYFKLCIFWVFSIIVFKAAFELDQILYTYVVMMKDEHSNYVMGGVSLNAVIAVCSSALILRTIVSRLFQLSMYPFMGYRTLKRIQKFHREGQQQEQEIMKEKAN